jgi:TetR/AcrR family transcriptional regulator, cholesterol catabolism regulator
MLAKEKILIRAIELFLREGVRRVTMDQLASSLGMSKRTIYETFRNKDELLKECIDNHISLQRIAIQEVLKKSPTVVHFYLSLLEIGVQNMKSSNPLFVDEVRIYYPEIWESTICANRDYNLNQTSVLLQQGKDEGVFRKDLDIPILSKLTVEFFTLLANSDIFPPHIYPQLETFKQTIYLVLRGLVSEKGLNILEDTLVNNEN